jgi:hypothetical protein
MPDNKTLRTIGELRRVVRALGFEFKVREEVDGRTVVGVAPSPEDLVVSKMARLDPRDRVFVEAIHEKRPLNLKLVEDRIRQTDLDPKIAERAISYIRSVEAPPEDKPSTPKPPPASSEESD